ncbi:MAG TPA: hypothetical protein VHP36_08815 [Chitinispirillaceae bacterium]|nr:hypothetical protein [Chitinispirillaceae bacterium]
MRRFLFVLCTAGFSMTASAAQETAAPDSSAFEQMLDSLGLSKNDLEAKVRSTLMFGGSSPVSFSGEARIKMQYHNYQDGSAKYLFNDRSYLQSNWEGNESFVRVGMVARAGRNTVLWSKIGFQSTLPGTFLNKSRTGDTLFASLHDKSNEAANIHEDMCAGIALRTVPASFWLKLGAIHWTEASPLSIWKSQPRTFAWEYLPFEVEQPIKRYYDYNIAKGEKSGRAAWNKKAFQGINLESINLPGNLYFNLLYGEYERYDNFEREYGDLGADQGYVGENIPSKGKGIGDPFRKVFHARFAATELLNKLTPGINFLRYNYNKDIVNSMEFKKVFYTNVIDSLAGQTKRTRVDFKKIENKSVGAKAFYKEPWVTTLDLRGPVNDKFSFHADFALSRIDSTIFEIKKDTSINTADSIFIAESKSSSSICPAFYAHIENKYVLPLHLDLAFISKGFYSPMSFATPADGFFPFGSNLLGPGKFIARGEASPYTQNMAGANLKLIPKITGYGHLRIIYGQHFQIKAAKDLLYFPYRLNGQDMFSSLHSSYNRWGNDPVDLSLPSEYKNRLGDESYTTGAYSNPVGYEGGALHSDFLAMYEGFVPYENERQATANLTCNKKGDTYGRGDQKDGSFIYTYTDSSSGKVDTMRSDNAFVPKHQKFTFNLELDYAYDLGKMLGYSHDLFFSVYAAVNGVSTSFKPLAFNEKKNDMLLWGTYVRFEPAIALSNKFYILGLAGFERWASNKSYIQATKTKAVASPMDYRDYAVGIGFDWDMLSRVGLHGRVKYMQHDDINIPENNYKTPVISTEIKMWF